MMNHEAVTVEEYLTERVRAADPEAGALTIHVSHLVYLINKFTLHPPASAADMRILCRAEALYERAQSDSVRGAGVGISFDLLGDLLADRAAELPLPAHVELVQAPAA